MYDCRFGYGSANNTRAVWKRNRDAGIPFVSLRNFQISFQINFSIFENWFLGCPME